jgi:hypothetical protein
MPIITLNSVKFHAQRLIIPELYFIKFGFELKSLMRRS